MLKLTANQIKAALIDYIIDEQYFGACLFGNEVIYGLEQRQADLIAINDLGTIVFEIKSELDDFRRSHLQLQAYRSVFDFQYIVTTENHLAKAESLISNSDGLILLTTDGRFVLKKLALCNKNTLNKLEILYSIPSKFLSNHFRVLSKSMKAVELRMLLMSTESIDAVRNAYLFFLNRKLCVKNEIFISEKGVKTHFEDLKYLTQVEFCFIR